MPSPNARTRWPPRSLTPLSASPTAPPGWRAPGRRPPVEPTAASECVFPGEGDVSLERREHIRHGTGCHSRPVHHDVKDQHMSVETNASPAEVQTEAPAHGAVLRDVGPPRGKALFQ